MASQKDKFQKFNENIENLRSTLYSLGINPVDKISDDFKAKTKDINKEEQNNKNEKQS